MSEMRFPLPDVGEGLTEAEIVSWKVAPGDHVALNQVLVEIETAKSLVELPSPFVGTVGEILVDEGTTVDVGTHIVTIQSGESADAAATPSASGPASSATAPSDGSGSDSSSAGAAGVGDIPSAAAAAGPAESAQFRMAGTADVPATLAQAEAQAEASASAQQSVSDTRDSIASEEPKQGSVLVGYGTGGQVSSRRTATSRQNLRPTPPASVLASVPAAAAVPIIVKPPIRKLAKDLGVALDTLEGTGLAGEITRDDVVRAASQPKVFRNIETPEWAPEREERIPVKGVRKAIANAMVQSAYTAPHVSLFVDVDATRTMEFVKRLKASTDFAGVKVSPLLIMAKAMIWAVRRNPMVNAAWTDEEIIVRHFVNLGVAAATPRGLIVPNVKDAQAMTLLELAQALEQLTLTARDGKTPPSDMQQGTITITNIGVFGMDTGTPILNPGEVAIVALGTIKQKPWVVDGEVRPRFVTTLGASFDHRVVDGDVASRFLADVAAIIEEPALLLD
jgi:2-oxoisovalerate dehydrogenase E2 component (dihydrolipoyl transacylase)